jgi:ketosteroid isomerase-like protein
VVPPNQRMQPDAVPATEIDAILTHRFCSNGIPIESAARLMRQALGRFDASARLTPEHMFASMLQHLAITISQERSNIVHEVEQSILHVLDAYKRAVFSKDVDAFIALYDHDVRVFDMWGEWSYTGVDAWRGIVQDWFGSLGREHVVVVFDEIQVVATHELAIASAFVTYRGVSAQNEPLRAMQNRITMVLTHTNGMWKIVHEHSSAPADFETANVILKR